METALEKLSMGPLEIPVPLYTCLNAAAALTTHESVDDIIILHRGMVKRKGHTPRCRPTLLHLQYNQKHKF